MQHYKKASEPYDSFLKTLKEHIPERGKLVNKLTDLLMIEREAVYRRLRGDVLFSFPEIASIAKEFNISLDVLISSASKSRPFLLEMVDYNNPEDEDYALLKNFLDILKTIKDDPKSEIGGAMNIIPQSLCLEYPSIYKFYLFKWMYQYGSTGSIMPFNEIKKPHRLLEINREIIETSRLAANSVYIIDTMTLIYMANDLKYYSRIQLITREEIEKIKEELFSFLENMERFARTGHFDNGHKMQLFVSSINFETSYSYIESATHKLSMIKSFTINDAISPDEKIFQNLKRWINALKKTSTLISGSGEIERIRFFNNQREIVKNM